MSLTGGFYADGLPEPGPMPFNRVQGKRKAYIQQATSGDKLSGVWRATEMAHFARRAVEWLQDAGFAEVDWLTLEFRVVNHGIEPEGTELWRWEVWVR